MKQTLITGRALVPGARRTVPYLTLEEVKLMAISCQERHQQRDGLLILTLFQTGLRV